MSKYRVEMKITLEVEAPNRKTVRAHAQPAFEGLFVNNHTVGFSHDRFRASCTSAKILKVEDA